ncbi:DUF6415 family natural product biosynthesis protein [Streptomyces sp. JNUCC 63]
MNASDAPTDAPLASVTVRAAASWFIDQPTLLRHQTVKDFEQDFRQHLWKLIAHLEQLTGGLPADDVPRNVALAGVGEARRRLEETEATGLHGEVERVKRLARSVIALCDHHDTLTGVRMCVVCDKPIEDGDPWERYDRLSPSGGADQPGRIHTRCIDAVRRR